jgi:hypothetical protein
MKRCQVRPELMVAYRGGGGMPAVLSPEFQAKPVLAARLPEDDCQQVDTSALAVKHPSRVRGADQWTGPGNDLAARFGRNAAHAE